NCAAVAMYDGPVELPREKTNTCPFELTATPPISPKWTSSGIVSGSGTDSNGSVGMVCAADGSAVAPTRLRARRNRFTIASRERDTRVGGKEYKGSAVARIPDSSVPIHRFGDRYFGCGARIARREERVYRA